jgi:hypothetical protein
MGLPHPAESEFGYAKTEHQETDDHIQLEAALLPSSPRINGNSEGPGRAKKIENREKAIKRHASHALSNLSSGQDSIVTLTC